jgi:hypothetical protein
MAMLAVMADTLSVSGGKSRALLSQALQPSSAVHAVLPAATTCSRHAGTCGYRPCALHANSAIGPAAQIMLSNHLAHYDPSSCTYMHMQHYKRRDPAGICRRIHCSAPTDIYHVIMCRCTCMDLSHQQVQRRAAPTCCGHVWMSVDEMNTNYTLLICRTWYCICTGCINAARHV